MAGRADASTRRSVAEHVMLVDLARNDVGRVAEFGTVHVDELMTLERYSHVMHLTSQVSGDAASTGRGPIDVLRATLPAGTVSRARRRCGRWRSSTSSSRSSAGPYAGVVGYVDFSRQPRHGDRHPHDVRRPDGGRRVQAGAGIVADSRPRRRGPRVPQQGRRPARRRPGRPPHDRQGDDA